MIEASTNSLAISIGRMLLWLCVPPEDADAIAGDLAEEYFADRLPRFGARRANRWYLSQALRSAIPLLVTRWRRVDLAGLTLAAIVVIFVPLRLADLLWAFVHSRIPLKDGVEWHAGFWAANLSIAMGCAAMLAFGMRAAERDRGTAAAWRSRFADRESVTLAILACGCAAASVAVSRGHAPHWYVEALLTAVPAIVACARFLTLAGKPGIGSA